MDILFVASYDRDQLLPNGRLKYPTGVQMGISSISAVLKKNGHRTQLLVLSRNFNDRNYELLDERIRGFRPKLICFTAVVTEYGTIRDFARYVKRADPSIYLAVGGVHATLNPQDVIVDDFDAVCVGEGEMPTLELVSQLEKGQTPSGIPNLWIKSDSKVERNEPRAFLQQLDSLPFMDRDMWREWFNDEQGPKSLAVLVGRGCPFNCSYCSNHALRKTASGQYIRCRSPRNVVAEIRDVLKSFPLTEEIWLEAETLTSNSRWCLELCDALADFNATLPQPLRFEANVRIAPNIDFDRIFAAFKKCNCGLINIGVESGSERVRREILKRDYSNSDVINTVALARKHGIKVSFLNMIGVPTETMADFKQTIELNRICKPDRSFRSIFFPYPGTDLHRLCRQMGLLTNEPMDTRDAWRRAVLDLPGFPKEDIQKCSDYYDYYLYAGYDPEDIGTLDVLRRAYRLVARIPYLAAVLRPLKDLFRKLFARGLPSEQGRPL